MNLLVLCLAQGFFIGRIPRAPGTFGSVLGLGWLALLLTASNWWALATGTLLGIALSVWCCGKAEKILGQTDPGSVVLDEVVAMPVCFLAWLSLHRGNSAQPPPPGSLLTGQGLAWTLAILI